MPLDDAPSALATTHDSLDALRGLLAGAAARSEGAESTATRRAHESDWRAFTGFCEAHGLPSLPAHEGAVVAYVESMIVEGYALATIRRHVATIAVAHRQRDLDLPTRGNALRRLLEAHRRVVGARSPNAKAAATVDVVRALLATLSTGLLGTRDRALLLLGYGAGLRRSELVGLDVADVEFTGRGVVVTVQRSKTDQTGVGATIGVQYGSSAETCPVRALRAWLDAAAIESGPIFRPVDRHGNVGTKRLSDHAVAEIVKRAAVAAGLDAKRFSGHSLRAGCVTSAATIGATATEIMAVTRHRSLAMVERYVRRTNPFDGSACGKLGL